MSTVQLVVISPITRTSPVVVAVSQATRAAGSCSMIASSTASEIWSQSLSGWPSVTDSEVNRSRGDRMKVRLLMEGLLLSRRSRPGFPRSQVPLLFGGQLVDLDPHRLKLQLGDLGVDLNRHIVYLPLQPGRVANQVGDGQCLIREAHIHDRGRMSLSGREVDQPSLGQHVDPSPIGQTKLLDKIADHSPFHRGG